MSRAIGRNSPDALSMSKTCARDVTPLMRHSTSPSARASRRNPGSESSAGTIEREDFAARVTYRTPYERNASTSPPPRPDANAETKSSIGSHTSGSGIVSADPNVRADPPMSM